MGIGGKPNQAHIRTIEITSWHGAASYDIVGLIGQFTLYEDLFSNSISADIQVADGVNLINALPIVGGEPVKIVIGSNDDLDPLDMTLYVYKLSNRRKIKEDIEVYTLHLTTNELLSDHGKLVNKSYKDTISNIVSKIFREYLKDTKKNLIIEPTEGIFNYVAPKISPFNCIKYLASEAKSISYPASNFVFFENAYGYTFATMDYLYSSESKHKFIYDTILKSTGDPGSNKKLYNNIIRLNHDNTFDILNGQMSGQYATSTFAYDPLVKKFTKTEYIYTKDK